MVLLKDTALGYIIAYPELLQQGVNVLAANYGNLVAAAIVIAAIYIVINSALTSLAHWLDRRTQRRGIRTVQTIRTGAAFGGGGTNPEQVIVEPQG